MFPKHTCGYTVLQTGCVYVRELDSTCSGTCQGETQHVYVFCQWKREELCRDWKLALTKWLGLSLGYLSHHCFITLFPSLFNSLLLFCRFLYSLTDTYEREHVNSTYTAILREDRQCCVIDSSYLPWDLGSFLALMPSVKLQWWKCRQGRNS